MRRRTLRASARGKFLERFLYAHRTSNLMVHINEAAGYVLAASVALAGASGARLKNTGQLSIVSKKMPLYTFAATILYGVSGMAALVYFSWAHLNWKHIVTFLVVGVALTGLVARSNSKAAVWTVFNLSTLAAAGSEVLMLLFSRLT